MLLRTALRSSQLSRHLAARSSLPAWAQRPASFSSSSSSSSAKNDDEELEKLVVHDPRAKVYELRQEYREEKKDFPVHSMPPNGEALDVDMAYRKRLIHRSRQRGWLEVDLLLGTWAEKHVMDLSPSEIKEYEEIVSRESIDIFNYVTGKDPVPPELQTGVMERLQEYSKGGQVRSVRAMAEGGNQ